MSITTEQYNRLCRFLDADMTLQEMEAFETELASHPEMRQQLDFEQSVRNSFSAVDKGKYLQNKIESSKRVVANGTGTEHPPVSGVEKKNYRKQWLAIAVAASVVIAIIAVVLIKQKTGDERPEIVVQNNKPVKIKKDTAVLVITNPATVDTAKTIDLNSLFKQNFTEDKLPESYPMYLAEAFTDYENGRYANLQKLNLQNIPDTRGQEESQEIRQLGHYYKGISFLKTGNTVSAITHLEWIVRNNTDASLKPKANWYLALAYVKNGEPEKAVEFLKPLAGSTNSYTTKAKNLLKKLRGE